MAKTDAINIQERAKANLWDNPAGFSGTVSAIAGFTFSALFGWTWPSVALATTVMAGFGYYGRLVSDAVSRLFAKIENLTDKMVTSAEQLQQAAVKTNVTLDNVNDKLSGDKLQALVNNFEEIEKALKDMLKEQPEADEFNLKQTIKALQTDVHGITERLNPLIAKVEGELLPEVQGSAQQINQELLRDLKAVIGRFNLVFGGGILQAPAVGVQQQPVLVPREAEVDDDEAELEADVQVEQPRRQARGGNRGGRGGSRRRR